LKSHLVNQSDIHKSNSYFPLSEHIQSFYETKSIPKLNSNYFQEKHWIKNTKQFWSTLEIHTYDCSLSWRPELQHLFLNYDVLIQPLTAIIIIFKTNSDISTWLVEVENEQNNLIN
jgi:hypothetical protein